MMYAIRHAPTSRQMRSLSTIAAPLLAAADVTLTAVIIPSPDSVAYPSLAIAALVFSAACLVTSVSASIWAAYYEAEPLGDSTESVTTPHMSRHDYQDAVAVYRAYSWWVKISTSTFRVGVFALWVGLGIALVPPTHEGWRLAVVVPVAMALLVQLGLKWVAPKAPKERVYWVVTQDSEPHARREPSR
jgi:hypothetical protein